MQRTRSTNHLLVSTQIPKSPSKRTIYINQEIRKKEIHTPFHSPYKNGRRNPDFSNPSFISSNIFYPQQFTQSTSNDLNLTSNQIPNWNDIKKQAQYRQRIHTDYVAEPKQRDDNQSRQFEKKTPNRYRVQRVNQPQNLLRNDFQNLHSYRQEIKNKKERIRDISRKRYDQPKEPVYLQKAKPTGNTLMTFSPQKPSNYEQKKAMVRQFDNVKQQLREKRDEQQYTCNLDQLIIRNQQQLFEEEQQRYKQKYLLGNILREQIKANRELKEKRWKY